MCNETYIAYKFYALYPPKGFFKGEFFFVRIKHHARYRYAFSSYQVMVHEDSSHKVFEVIFGHKQFLHLKSH